MVKKAAPKKPAKKANPNGRPTVYKVEYNQIAYKLNLLGVTDKRLAEILGVSETTLTTWKKKYPKFLLSINEGKELADGEVAVALYQRAKGYSHKEDKIFSNGVDDNGKARKPLIVETTKHYPPDTAAAFIWLKNRAGWRDRQEHAHTADGLSFNMNFGAKGDKE